MAGDIFFDACIKECIEALELEIYEMKANKSKKEEIYDGLFIYEENGKYIYFFKTDEELYLMDSSPIVIYANNTKVEGELIFCEKFEVFVALDNYIGYWVDNAYLYCEPWELLVALKEHLKLSMDSSFYNKDLVKKLILEIPKSEPEIGNKEIKKIGQEFAIHEAMSNDITFIWGPPGTGKTHTLANIALNCIKNHEKVLVISHSNIAVDNAIEAIRKILEGKNNNNYLWNSEIFPIVRYGYSRSELIRSDPLFNSYNQALNKDKDLKEKIGKLINKIEELYEKKDYIRDDIKLKLLISYRKALGRYINEVKKIEKESVIPNADIVATTISKAQIDETVFNKFFDVVILDEASMAYIPQSIYAATLARKRVIYIGDFKQLSPIALAESPLVDKLLRNDIFEFSKLKNYVMINKFHPNMVMLYEQRRMDPSISRFVNMHIYKFLLKDHYSIITNRLPQDVLSIIDTSFMDSICMRDENKSRFNVFSAFISVFAAIECCDKGLNSIGIITPYNTQSRLIKAILNDLHNSSDNREKRISCSTVHRFQGSEEDAIIFDTVDGYRIRKAGMLLTEDDKSERLINVAITRAKKKFIAVSNLRYFDTRLSNNQMLYNLFEYLNDNGTLVNHRNFFEVFGNMNARDDNKLTAFFLNENLENAEVFFRKMAIDIIKAQSTFISIPNHTKNSLKLLTQILSRVDLTNIKIFAENPNNLPEALKEIAEEDSFAWLPLIIIDKKIIYYGFPFIKSSYTYYNCIIRFEGEKTAKLLISKLKFIEKKKQYKANNKDSGFKSFIEENYRCGICKSPLTVVKSKKNRYFIGCSNYPNCKNNKYIEKFMLDSFLMQHEIICSKCGSDMMARVGKHGLFIGCKRFPVCNNIVNLNVII